MLARPSIRTSLPRLVFVLLLALTAGAFAQGPGAGRSVQPAVARWESARPVEAITARLLQELGYDVKPPRSMTASGFYGAVQNGDVDFWANGWFPLHEPYTGAGFDGKASVVGAIVEGQALQGYLVDRRSIETYDIRSLADFRRQEVRRAFDIDGNGKADLVGCPLDWPCADVIAHQISAYGLGDYIDVTSKDYTAAFADLRERFDRGEPILYYGWTPNYTMSELMPGRDVQWINVPYLDPTAAQKGLASAMTVAGLAGAVSDPLKMGFPPNDIRFVANKRFLAQNPAAAELFRRVQVPVADITRMAERIHRAENSPQAIDRVASEWIGAHRDEVDGWLARARNAAANAPGTR